MAAASQAPDGGSEVFFEVRGIAGLSELVDTRFKEMAICPTPDGD
jgi:hypothetical protein